MKPLPILLLTILFLVGAHAAERPNILVLLADDLGMTDLSCYGGTHATTPNLDQLAADGMRFTHFYAAAPNCSPSRAGLLTGRIPARTGIYSYIPTKGPLYLPEEEDTVAELLLKSGYQTMHSGKWHLVHDLLRVDLPQPSDHGFLHSLGTDNNASPNHHQPDNFVRNGRPIGPVEGYSCDFVVDEVMEWLTDRRDPEQPFFVCAWFHETHTPIASPPEMVARHEGLKKKDALYNANVENLDQAAGRLLDYLDENGLTDNTLVIFSSDNGGLNARSNGNLRGRKSFVWEGGIREPGIFRWPGIIEPGSVSDEPVGLVDLLPTFVEIGEADLPEKEIDGVSLLPLFKGEEFEREGPLFWFFYRVEPAAAMRRGDWVIAGYLEGEVPPSHPLSEEQMKWLKETPLTKFELYNTATDPSQETDVANDYPERFDAMRQEMISLHADVVAEGPIWEFP